MSQHVAFAAPVLPLRGSRVSLCNSSPVTCSAARGGIGDSVARAGAAALAASLLALSMSGLPTANAVLSKGLCVSGEGPGCAERTEDNPLIRDLQEKSRANKDKHEQATRDRYWSEGYGSYFSYGFGRELRKDLTTGEWSLVRPDDEMAKAVERAGLDWRNID